MGADDGRDPEPFARPRIVVAGVLTGILGLLLLVDAVSSGYQVSEVTITVLLGSVLTLLGIESADVLRRRR